MAFFSPGRPAYRDNPYPSLARLRRDEPVHYSHELQAWVLTRYDDCVRVLQDDSSFSSDLDLASGPAGAAYAARRRSVPLGDVAILSNSDAPAHTRLRNVVSRAFTPRVIEAMRPRVQELVDENLADAGPTLEVINDLAAPLVTTTILEQLGVPRADHETFRGLTIGIVMAHSGDPARLDAAQTAHQSLIALVDRWRAEGSVLETSVLGSILAAPEKETVTRDEMLMLLINIGLSGNGATINGIGNAVLALAEHLEAARQLIAGDVPMAVAVDELLRFDSPAHVVTRIAKTNLTLASRNIRAGDPLHVILGAANRDPAHFPNPDTLDFTRKENRHITFGYASHFCLGAPLARIQIETVISALFRRYGLFRVQSLQRSDSFLMRGPGELVIASA